MTFIKATQGEIREAEMMVPDLYRHTTKDDLSFVVRNGDGWTIALHESYDDETIEEHVASRPTFPTEALAEQYAWFWIVEGVDNATEYYTDAAKALIEGLVEWEAVGRVFDSRLQGWRYDGSLDQYDESLHRMVVTLKRGEEVRKFKTVNEAHIFICEEADYGEFDLKEVETTLPDGAILTEYVSE